MKNIILIAAPAAGKGTLSELLVEKYGYIHISTGDLLREASKEKSELGEKIATMLKNGELVSDEIVFELLENKLKVVDKPYILDGFPRTINQAYKYDELITKLNKSLGIVVVLNCDYDILKNRIVGRWLCKECGSIYNTLTGVNTPKEENICDKCGGELYKRSDDNEESFKTRYETYLEKTKPLIDFYQEKGNLHYVNSETKDIMLKEIEDLL
ncbi:MAG: nucleoside monophosphate kinase [Erysipelotrichaceae bacterium]|nr:nucleoside monophosphate kinase [Erysipelotrichaceae bacterium]